MERVLSSSTTVIHRRIIPVILGVAWVADLVVAVAVAVKMRTWAWSLIPIPTAIIFWFVYRSYCAPFADHVIWVGGELRVRKGSVETTIPLRQIESIRSSLEATPQRITLELREASPLGKTIVFVPQVPKRLMEATQESEDIRQLRAKIA